jgi:UPF0176 protein
MSQYTIVAFYKFVELPNLSNLQTVLQKNCKKLGVLGTILLAPEGINGTLAGKEEDIKAILTLLESHEPLADLEYKYSHSDHIPFRKTKILIKKEIVTFDAGYTCPSKKTGKHISPEEWNQLITEPDVLIIDTRNTYEIELGTFKDAINPQTKQFTDFPNFVKENLEPRKHKKIAMFCTGGIRCEKASTYLLDQGFENVYQLQGGILKYLEKIKPQQSLWQGKCFIFDDRITLDKEAIKKV